MRGDYRIAHLIELRSCSSNSESIIFDCYHINVNHMADSVDINS